MFAIRSSLALAFIVAGHLSSWAQEAQLIRVAFPALPPFSYFDADGPRVGLAESYLLPVCNDIGAVCTAKYLPIRRYIRAIADGEADAMAGPINLPIDRQAVTRMPLPIANAKLKVFSIGFEPNINQISDLRGKQIILQAGMRYGELRDYVTDRENRVTVVGEAEDPESALRMLIAARAPYLIQFDSIFWGSVKQVGARENFRMSEIADVPIYLYFSNRLPDVDRLIARISGARIAQTQRGSAIE